MICCRFKRSFDFLTLNLKDSVPAAAPLRQAFERQRHARDTRPAPTYAERIAILESLESMLRQATAELCRAVDAFGGTALLVTGHAADPYDPKCVRASTGSLFSVPVIRAASHREILAWVHEQRARGVPVVVIGTDEHSEVR